MADVTLGFDELETNDLPPVCVACGARRGVDFVERKFVWSPPFAPPLLRMILTKRVRAEIPLCRAHGGPRLLGYTRFYWWGLTTVAIGPDRLTIGRADEDFAEALHRWRTRREPGEIGAARRRRSRVRYSRGPGGGGTVLKVLGILLAAMAALTVVMVVGMVVLMGVATIFLPKAAPPPVIGPVPAAAAVEPKPEAVVAGLLAVAPDAVGPAALPWAPLALSARKKTFHLLEDSELDRALADLKSPNPNAVAAASKKLAQSTPDPVRRREAAEALTTATANPFPTARQAAAAGLAVWGAADDVPSLARMLADPIPDVKTSAIVALAGLKDPKAAAAVLPELEKAARDPNPNVARAAAEAAKAVKDRQTLEEKQP